MKIHLKIWRQKRGASAGEWRTYGVEGISGDMSFLEMLDLLNDDLTSKGETPVEFDSDCREGICGSCGFMINGQAHGPGMGVAVCQVYMRRFRDGASLTIEPWRARAFPVIQDLVVDRGALDRIIEAGGYVSARVGPHPDGNSILIPREVIEQSLDAGSCIQCGACVAACPNASAALFTGAQVTRLALVPQGKVETSRRVVRMVDRMDREGFGHCTNIAECEAACPKRISISTIALMRREYRRAIRGD